MLIVDATMKANEDPATDPEKDENTVVIHTDGACRGNPGPGGWGALVRWRDQEKRLQGGASATTNNRMELTAAIEGLTCLKRPCQVILVTDSTYVRNGITQWIFAWKRRNWRKSDGKPVENIDLWQLLDAQIGRHQVTWRWVRGHAGNPDNEIADGLAREAVPGRKAG